MSSRKANIRMACRVVKSQPIELAWLRAESADQIYGQTPLTRCICKNETTEPNRQNDLYPGTRFISSGDIKGWETAPWARAHQQLELCYF